MTTPKYPLIPEPVTKSWLERNPLWKIPVGALLILSLGIVTSIPGLFIANRTIRESEPYQVALEHARENPRVTEVLGSPFNPGIWTWGRFKVNGSSGYARLSIPVSGPKGSGTIEVCARKAAGQWAFQSMRLHIPGQASSWDLLQVEAPQPAPPAQ